MIPCFIGGAWSYRWVSRLPAILQEPLSGELKDTNLEHQLGEKYLTLGIMLPNHLKNNDSKKIIDSLFLQHPFSFLQ